jgi:hypothetical protein
MDRKGLLKMSQRIILILTMAVLLSTTVPTIAQNADTPPAILYFDWSVRDKNASSGEEVVISLDAVERGEIELTLSWGVLYANDGQHVELETYRIQGWETIFADDNDRERPHSINGQRVLDLQHPLNFGPPTYRLSLFDREDTLLEARIITIPYDHDPETKAHPEVISLSAPLNINADDLDAIPVSWEVENRWPGTNLVFEQVLPDGSVWSAELPRAHQWIASQGEGILQARPPTAGNAIILRLHVVNMQTGETYDQAAVVVAVGPDNVMTESEEQRTQGVQSPAPAEQTGNQTSTDTTTTINTGEPLPRRPDGKISTQAAFQRFEDGFMIWNSAWGDVWVLSDNRQAFFYPESSYAALPENLITEIPPAGLFAPVRGFGKVWGSYVNVRQVLGWAVAEEEGYTIDIETLSTTTTSLGTMVVYLATLPDGRSIRIRNNGPWDFYELDPNQPSQIIHLFNVSPSSYHAGDLMSVSWSTSNTDSVIIEVYDLANQSDIDARRPFQRFDDLAPNGTLNYIIPEPYPQGVRFVLLAAAFDNTGQYDTDVTSPVDVHRIAGAGPEYNMSQTQGAYQTFEGGFMLWREDTGMIYALLTSGSVITVPLETYNRLPDNPISEPPPSGRVKPVSGFGRVWGNMEPVRSALGWGLALEQGYSMVVYTYVSQAEAGDVALSLPTGNRIIIRSDQTWTQIP